MSSTNAPQRSCVICRKKDDKKLLLRFIVLDKELVFDTKKVLQARGYYVCDENECIEKLTLWKTKRLKRLLKTQKKK